MNAALLSPTIQERSTTHGEWLAPLQNWPATAIRSLQTQSAVVRLVIASVRGSSPREVGTSMLVEHERIFGTIGGGQLEWAAIAAARGMLASSTASPVQLQKLILGPQLSQCCGGAVELWLERYVSSDLPLLTTAVEAAARGPAFLMATLANDRVERRIIRHPAMHAHAREMIRRGARAELVRLDDGATLLERLDQDRPHVWLYGAGHVGQALARVLATLPMQLTWIDSRPELLPVDFSSSVHTLLASDPVATVHEAPRGTRFLVMTHSHPLDYALCRAVLERNDQTWLGVIGSKSKSVRFRSRLLSDGLSRESVASLVCPIGVGGIDSKLPEVIAISVATQLLQTFAAPARTGKVEAHDCAGGTCHNCALQPGAAQ